MPPGGLVKQDVWDSRWLDLLRNRGPVPPSPALLINRRGGGAGQLTPILWGYVVPVGRGDPGPKENYLTGCLFSWLTTLCVSLSF